MDFNSVLSMPASAVEKPKPRPPGTYQASVMGQPKQTKRTAQGEEKDIVSFLCKIVAPIQVDDQEALAGSGDISSWPPFNKDFWFSQPPSPEEIYNFKRFLTDTLGVDPGEGAGEKSLGEMCSESSGKGLVVTLINVPYISKQTQTAEIATNIGATARL